MTTKLRCINRPSGWVEVKTKKMVFIEYGTKVTQADFDIYVKEYCLTGMPCSAGLNMFFAPKHISHEIKDTIVV